MVLVNALPVQRLRHFHPARLFLDGEDALRGGVCPLPRDAVEDLGVFVPVGFDLGGDMGGSVPLHPQPRCRGMATTSISPNLDMRSHA